MWRLGLWMSIESDDSQDDSMEQECTSSEDHQQGVVCGLMESDLKPSEHMYAQQVTMTEYEKQSQEYTKQALHQLLNSEEYQKVFKTCGSCNACWFYEQASPNCAECGEGGYTIHRPCAICHGKCQQIWTRDVEMSHKMKEAHWNGECGLPDDEQRAYILKNLIDADEDVLAEAMEDL